MEINNLISSAFGLDHSANKAKVLGKNLPGFNKEMQELRALNAANGGKLQGGLLTHDYSHLKAFMNGGSDTSSSNESISPSVVGSKKAKSINEGGQRLSI